MSLELHAVLGSRNLDARISVGKGETVAIMGPNGAGKSSLIQILSGLLKPDAGHATLAGKALFRFGSENMGSESTCWLPPHQRGIGLLAQDALLFPHLFVLDNVAFGPRSQGHSKEESATLARQWLREVDALELAARKPAQLSGGQAQRVALARALATDPQLLLLDEPMAALDVNTAPFLRSLLKRVLADRSTIIVTHHVLDALMLADRIIVMEQGRIIEQGPTHAVLSHPRSAFAASLAGLNVLTGTFEANTNSVRTSTVGPVLGRLVASTETHSTPVSGDLEAIAAFAPSSVSVFLERPAGSPRNCFAVQVSELEPRGDHIRVRAEQLSADISPAAMAELGLAPGSNVYFVVKAAEVVIYPA